MFKVLFFMFFVLFIMLLDNALDPSMIMYEELRTVNGVFIALGLLNIFIGFLTIGKE